MQIDYSRRQGEEVDVLQSAMDAAGEIRMRIQPQLFSVGGSGKKLYLGWKGVYWNLTCESAVEAVEVREVMATFFRQMEEQGVGGMQGWLDQLDRIKAGAVESAPSEGDDGTIEA